MGSIAHWRRTCNRNLLSQPIVAEALSQRSIEAACRQAGHRWRASFWSPTTTVLTFLLQVIDSAKTLRSAVANLLIQRAGHVNAALASADPSAFCQARRRLPLGAMQRLLDHVTARVRELVAGRPDMTWRGRRIWVADGSSASMPDTPSLQRAFPQPIGQKPGCGFPVARIVALFCWASGAIVDLLIDGTQVGELTLCRRLFDRFAPDDVVLGDRIWCSYTDIARLRARGVHVVTRLHQRRKPDFRRGQRLGKDDRLVKWARPERWLPSFGVSKESFEELPQEMTLRMVRITGVAKGFRSRIIVVVTTLLDPAEIPAEEIRALYRDRWTAELNLRNLKIDLGMDILRGKTPDVVAKEILMHALVYNVIRLLMWQAARDHGRDLHRLSFTGTLHRMRHALPALLLRRQSAVLAGMLDQLLVWIAEDRLPHRPDRFEPRRVKRRPKQFRENGDSHLVLDVRAAVD